MKGQHKILTCTGCRRTVLATQFLLSDCERNVLVGIWAACVLALYLNARLPQGGVCQSFSCWFT